MIPRQATLIPDLRPQAPVYGRVLAAMIMGGVCLLGGLVLNVPEIVARGLIAAGLTFVLVTLLLMSRAHVRTRARDMAADVLSGFIQKDAVPSFVADDEGVVHARNDAAGVRFAGSNSDTLSGTLRVVFANPQAVLYRLQCRAIQDGAAREDVVTRRGHVRLAVHQLGQQGFLWRVEDMPERAQHGRMADSMPVPMLTVGRSGAVLFMNDAARAFVGARVKSLDRLFVSLPVQSGTVNKITTEQGQVNVVLAEHQNSAGRRELFFLPAAEAAAADHAAVFETLPVPMIKVAPTGVILTINRLAANLLGPGIGDGMKIGQVMQGLGRPVIDWLSDTAEGTSRLQSEFLRLMRHDKEVFVQVTLSRVIEEGRTVLIAVLNDATELKTLEAQFVQSQKMQAIGQLAGGVAHDFNNLLTAISGHCDLLLLRHDQGDQDYGDLVQINQNANRAAALVSQLLAFSRKQTLRPEVLDLRDTLSDLTHLLNRLVGEKVTLTLSHDPVLRTIRADKRQLEQVLMNLVVNARDAMPQGGEIRIETEVVTLGEPLKRDRATVPAGDL